MTRRAARALGVMLLATASLAGAVAVRGAATPRAPVARTAAARALVARDTLPFGPRLDSAPTLRIEDQVYLGANDLGRLLDATRFWRSDIRKLVMRAGAHRFQFAIDNPFVLVDDTVIRLPAIVRSLGGEAQVPIAFVDSLPRDSTIARLLYDPRRGSVLVLPPGGLVRGPAVSVDSAATRLVFRTDRPEEVAVLSRGRAHFRVRFPGFFGGTLPDSFARGSLVGAMRPIGSATGSAFELEVAPAARGYRLTRDLAAHAVTLEFSRLPAALEAFAPEGVPTGLRVIVLDPGHGGADPGVSANGITEKDLALRLARLVRVEIERRLAVQVLLTRDDDRPLTNEQRAAIANRSRADLFVSLHFDGFPDGRAHGATAWCPPATSTVGAAPRTRFSPVVLLPWREVALGHAVQSRAFAEAVLSALELHGDGPTRLRERLPYSLVGVDAPGVMIDCATLSSPADRMRMGAPGGLARLAVGIADGVVAYGRRE